MRVVLDNPHITLLVDDERRLIVYRRKATKLTIPELDGMFADVARAQGRFDRASWHLLIDTREAPMNNTPEFEAAMNRAIGDMTAGWRRRAVVVKTAVGVLQVNRQSRTNPGADTPNIFRDEAIAWLLAPSPPGS